MSYLVVSVLILTAMYLAARDWRRYVGKHRSVARGNQTD